MSKAFEVLCLNLNNINLQLLYSTAEVSHWESGPPQTYVCGYYERQEQLGFHNIL